MADHTNAQRQARWRQRQKARNAELQKKVDESYGPSTQKQAQAQTTSASDEALRNALKQAKARNIHLQCENVSLHRALNQAEGALKRLQAASAKPKRPPKPPLDPDSQLARALKANRELRSRIRTQTYLHEEEMRRNGKMKTTTHRALQKCVHPDSRPTEEEREHACKLLNDFWGASR